MIRRSGMRVVLARFILLLALGSVFTGAALYDEAVAQDNQPTWIFVLRHAEKGSGDDPDLTDDGVRRAEELRHALGWAGVSRIFVTPTKRSCQTAAPLAACLSPEKDDQLKCPWKSCEEYENSQELMSKIFPQYQGKVVAVVGHANTVQDIVQALTGKSLDYYDGTFDNLFVLSVAAKGKGAILHLKYGFPATLQTCK